MAWLFNHCILIFLEIAWKSSIADNIWTTVVITDVFQVCCSLHDELFSDLEWNQAGIFTDNEEMKQIIFISRFFYKILVSEGKRVGVHDESSNLLVGVSAVNPSGSASFAKVRR